MIQKKTAKGDLEKRKKNYFILGLASVLALVYVCFEFLAVQDSALVFVTPNYNFAETMDENMIVINHVLPMVAQQQQQQEIILNVVENNTAPSTDVDFSNEFHENFEKEEYITTETQEYADGVSSYRFLDELPEFIGGEKEMYRFLQSNLVYPESAIKSKISGKVLVEFVVERDGRVTNVKIVNHLHPDCDKEAVRVIQMMPKWKPGKAMGKPVKYLFRIPVAFNL